MAFLGGGVFAVDYEDIACPICFEEFEEPKSLPSCAHNVCYQCLKGMTRKNSKNIECPVCRKKSKIPSGGVAGFPKDHLLGGLIDRMPGRKEKKMVSEALKNCEEKLEALRNSLTEMKSHFETAQEKAEETRQEIRSTASRAVERVKEEERRLLEQVDRYMRKHFNHDVCRNYEEDVVDLLERASICVESCQELLDKGELDDLMEVHLATVTQLNEFAKSSEERTSNTEREFELSYGLTFKPSESLENFQSARCLGTLHKHTDDIAFPIKFGHCGCLIRQIDGSCVGDVEFNPFALAVSRISGDLAMLDERKRCVHIVNFEGKKQSKLIQIQYGDLWDIAFSKDDEVLVTNREANRILHYNRNGKFEKKFVDIPLNFAGPHNFKFTYVSMDSEGRYLVTSSPSDCDEGSVKDANPGVCVFSQERELKMIFGTQGQLKWPRKGIWHKGEFFVPDVGKDSIVVFDKCGRFCRAIGKGVLRNPCSIHIDSVNDNILVCDYDDDSIKIFKTSGTFISEFYTNGSPCKISISKGGKEIVLLCHSLEDHNEDKMVVEILSYIP